MNWYDEILVQLSHTHEHAGIDIIVCKQDSPVARNLLLGASQPVRLSELKEQRRQ